jgi:hypothetical protein
MKLVGSNLFTSIPIVIGVLTFVTHIPLSTNATQVSDDHLKENDMQYDNDERNGDRDTYKLSNLHNIYRKLIENEETCAHVCDNNNVYNSLLTSFDSDVINEDNANKNSGFFGSLLNCITGFIENNKSMYYRINMKMLCNMKM